MTMQANEVPNLAGMAAPFLQPNTLPPGVSPSEAMIAHYDPDTLYEATREARNAYSRCYFDRHDDDITEQWDRYNQERQDADRTKRFYITELEAETDAHLDKLAELASDGRSELPAEGTDYLSGLIKYKDGLARQGAEDDPQVQGAVDALAAEVVKQAEIEVRETHLRETAALADTVCLDIYRLSGRKHRIAELTGALLGASISLGIIHLASAADNPTPEAGMLPSQHVEQVDDGYQPDTRANIIAGVIGGAAGVGVGGLVGVARRGAFAQNRAAQLVRRATKRQNQVQ